MDRISRSVFSRPRPTSVPTKVAKGRVRDARMMTLNSISCTIAPNPKPRLMIKSEKPNSSAVNKRTVKPPNANTVGRTSSQATYQCSVRPKVRPIPILLDLLIIFSYTGQTS